MTPETQAYQQYEIEFRSFDVIIPHTMSLPSGN